MAIRVGEHVLNLGMLGKVLEIRKNGELVLLNVGLQGQFTKWIADPALCDPIENLPEKLANRSKAEVAGALSNFASRLAFRTRIQELLEEYIGQVEHQHGDDYWTMLGDTDAAVADFLVYVEAVTEEQNDIQTTRQA